MREVQTAYQAELQYLSQFGDYAATLAALGPPSAGDAGPHAAKLIAASLASGERNGYQFTLSKTASGFTINANPKVFDRDGSRTFCIDEEGVLRQNWSRNPATVNSPEVK